MDDSFLKAPPTIRAARELVVVAPETLHLSHAIVLHQQEPVARGLRRVTVDGDEGVGDLMLMPTFGSPGMARHQSTQPLLPDQRSSRRAGLSVMSFKFCVRHELVQPRGFVADVDGVAVTMEGVADSLLVLQPLHPGQ